MVMLMPPPEGNREVILYIGHDEPLIHIPKAVLSGNELASSNYCTALGEGRKLVD
jgi:hypothetical protein